MPNYEDLRAFFEESGELREIASVAARSAIVTGFTIDVDPLWALLHDLGTGLVHRGAPAWLDDYFEFFPGLAPPWYPEFVDLALRPESVWYGRCRGYRRRDLRYTDPRWEDLRSFTRGRYGYDRLPIVMTVVHRPIRPPTRDTGGETDDQDQLRKLIGILNEVRVLVRVEERPLPRFSCAAGDEIKTSGGKTGTLGGVLHDISGGKTYGSTCAHVAVTSDHVTDVSGNPLGQCIADTGRVPLSGTTVCDPINLPLPHPYPGNGPSVNMLDCALVDLTSTVSTPQLAGIAGALAPGQDVIMEGAQNRVHCKLGALAISYSFSEHGQDYCFRDVIELLPQPWGPFGGTLGRMTTTMPTQGDSGAWVLTDDAVPIWAALFFGEDGQRGFAIRASWVHDWAERAVRSSLTV